MAHGWKSERRVVVLAVLLATTVVVGTGATALYVLEDHYGIALITEQGGKPCFKFMRVNDAGPAP